MLFDARTGFRFPPPGRGDEGKAACVDLVAIDGHGHMLPLIEPRPVRRSDPADGGPAADAERCRARETDRGSGKVLQGGLELLHKC